MIIAMIIVMLFYCFKETQLVTYTCDTICKVIQRESISLFSAGRFQAIPVV